MQHFDIRVIGHRRATWDRYGSSVNHVGRGPGMVTSVHEVVTGSGEVLEYIPPAVEGMLVAKEYDIAIVLDAGERSS